MRQSFRIRRSLLLLLGLFIFLAPQTYAIQENNKDKSAEGTQLLWSEPTDITSRDLLLGPGGEEMKPDLTRLTLIKEEKGGYSKKYRVKDAQGREWVAKIGKEAQSETAAVRLVWAVGYVSEINYLAPEATIEGKGTFENVRFEARPDNIKREDEWRWERNPFTGTREMQGLKVLMALMENWDLKDSNNRVIVVTHNGRKELHYIVSDLGATFGKTGGQWSPIAMIRKIKGSRNDPEDYANDEFVEGVRGDTVRLDYNGKNSSIMHNITVEDARWIGGWLSRLSDEQLQDAFRAANYSQVEVRMLAGAVRRRINELVNLRPEARIGRDTRR